MSKPLPLKGTRKLDHILSEDDITTMTHNLTQQMMDVVQLQQEKKQNAAAFKRKIDVLNEQNNNLAVWLNAGKQELDTAVEVYHNWPKVGVKTIVRMDTNESWEEEMGYQDNTLDNNLPSGVQDGHNDEEE